MLILLFTKSFAVNIKLSKWMCSKCNCIFPVYSF